MKKRYYVDFGNYVFRTGSWEPEQYETFIKLCRDYCESLPLFCGRPLSLAVNEIETWNNWNEVCIGYRNGREVYLVNIFPDTLLRTAPSAISTKIIQYNQWGGKCIEGAPDVSEFVIENIEFLAKEVDALFPSVPDTPEGREGANGSGEAENVAYPAVAPPPEEDIADILNKLEGRWVSPADFKNSDINSWRSHITGLPYTTSTMQKYRETGNYRLSHKTITTGRDAGGVLGQDKGGVYFKRTGNFPTSYRYEYFLEEQYDLTLTPRQK